jgi:hypothetical protein
MESRKTKSCRKSEVRVSYGSFKILKGIKMKSIKQAFRRLFRKGENTATRIISLTAGLAFGILLLAEVLLYFSFDGFIPMQTAFTLFTKTSKPTNRRIRWPVIRGKRRHCSGLKSEVPALKQQPDEQHWPLGVLYRR